MKTELTGIVPFTYFGGAQKIVGSTFLRVDGLVDNFLGFEKYKHGYKYDNLIFQKAYWTEMMDIFPGPKILDLCDPDWVNEDIEIIEIANKVHAVTCSSFELTQVVKKILPGKFVKHVPDRLNFKIYPEPRAVHVKPATNLLWFGFIHNAHESLASMAPTIKKLGLKLKIVADKPYTDDDEILSIEPEFALYEQHSIYEIIKNADIVLNPKSEKAFFKNKSNNKSLISWKLGVPVAHSVDELLTLLVPEARNTEVVEKKIYVAQNYNIQLSGLDYLDVIKEIRIRYKF